MRSCSSISYMMMLATVFKIQGIVLSLQIYTPALLVGWRLCWLWSWRGKSLKRRCTHTITSYVIGSSSVLLLSVNVQQFRINCELQFNIVNAEYLVTLCELSSCHELAAFCKFFFPCGYCVLCISQLGVAANCWLRQGQMHFVMNSFSQRAAQLLTLSPCYVVSRENF